MIFIEVVTLACNYNGRGLEGMGGGARVCSLHVTVRGVVNLINIQGQNEDETRVQANCTVNLQLHLAGYGDSEATLSDRKAFQRLSVG